MGPAIIHYYYFDFFSKNPPDFFKESILRRIGFVSEYHEIGIYRMIGKLYMNSVDNSVNNGLFSDAFMNLGYVGLLVMPILIILVIKVFQAVSSHLPLSVLVPCSFMMAFTIVSNSFFRYFITHGFLMFMIILYLWPREKENITCVV